MKPVAQGEEQRGRRDLLGAAHLSLPWNHELELRLHLLVHTSANIGEATWPGFSTFLGSSVLNSDNHTRAQVGSTS